MACVIKFRYEQHPGVGYLSQKLATSLGGKEQSPGPQSLGKNLPESQGQTQTACASRQRSVHPKEVMAR